MNTRKGTELHPADQRHVLSAYVHRYTKEHQPQWARGEWKDGKPYPVQFESDLDWLEHTRFKVRKDGRLVSRARYCEARPTWPNNPELRA